VSNQYGLSHVLPVLAMDNGMDRGDIQPCSACQFVHGRLPFGVELAHFADLLLGNLRLALSLASHNALRVLEFIFRKTSIPAAFHGIMHIIQLCARQQMGRIDACGIVTGVPNQESCRNGAICQFITETMSGNPCTVTETTTKPSISLPILGCNPGPAFVLPTLVDFGPKSRFNWLAFIRAALHPWCWSKHSIPPSPTDCSTYAYQAQVPSVRMVV
jgi:hypothetical protein